MTFGTVFDIKEFALHDGPGARVTVFLKGCPLRCAWCHNPEGLSAEPQLMARRNGCLHCGRCALPCSHPECKPFGRCLHACPEGLLTVSGKRYSSQELVRKLLSYASFLNGAEGGITFSGGEPTMQADFLCECAQALRSAGVNVAVETCGFCSEDDFRRLLGCVDYLLFDIKLASCSEHRRYTGVGNERILRNFLLLRKSSVPFTVRTPLIAGITDTVENLSAVASIISDGAPFPPSAPSAVAGRSDICGITWEKLPQNALAGAKYPSLGIEYPLS